MRNLIKVLAFTVAGLLCLPLLTQAQEGNERIRALRVAFITDKLKLTPEESEKFWPVYNQYEAEHKRIRQKYKPDEDLNTMSDQDVERAIFDRFEMEEQLIKLKRDYFQRMKGFMAVRKLALLQRSEQEFNKELLRRIQEARKNRK
ncbi:hypothetical protein [Haliscomenobacter hydrossis]|uniref:Sensor of ECF-type sigma factor n=1 Tax=Haliscomenobacter hydrossis (strain ATCC 27775 / DSM 1100 / LMG 10767 / O) TaxID=760192 RepID=F4KUC5_HALH1|nr:hypothetical protein [Haliscomenobacter hydrossis]AEE51207.1 hypothetical protein Halhy_3348 [Haliscomenobacter hydrossis DSM 1100]